MTARFGKDNICTKCGAQFPRCLSDDILACLWCSVDMFDVSFDVMIRSEIERRGLSTDTDSEWISLHKCIGHGANDES